MTLPQTSIAKNYSTGVDFFDALSLSNGRAMLSNSQVDEILKDEKARLQYKDAFPMWTGTIIVYEKAGVPFGTTIKGRDGVTFDIPKKYQGKKDCAIVIESPNYSLTKTRLTATKTSLIENFPKKNGWYLPDSAHGIPQGKEAKDSDKNARYLWRNNTDSIVPLSRYFDVSYGDGLRAVDAEGGFGARLGVVFVQDERLVRGAGTKKFPETLDEAIDSFFKNRKVKA